MCLHQTCHQVLEVLGVEIRFSCAEFSKYVNEIVKYEHKILQSCGQRTQNKAK